MKSVLISIQPKWCELIASGKKTVEVRKTRPKLEKPFKCYIYCTKDKKDIFFPPIKKPIFRRENFVDNPMGNGKVIGEFVCDDIGEFKVFENGSVQYWNYHNLGNTCLTYEELANYIGKNKDGYGWHISDLVIYYKPRELSEFRKPIECHRGNERQNCVGCWDCEIKRPPQSWCYVDGSDTE